MKQGDRELTERLRRADTIVVLENWAGWSVHVSHRGIEVCNAHPFRTKRDAAAWLRTWVDEPRPLHCTEPGTWVWRRSDT